MMSSHIFKDSRSSFCPLPRALQFYARFFLFFFKRPLLVNYRRRGADYFAFVSLNSRGALGSVKFSRSKVVCLEKRFARNSYSLQNASHLSNRINL